MKPLAEIFNSRSTDKGTVHGDRHNYAPVYGTLFAPLRNKEINLLEIGIFKGASILSWHDYFAKASIVGVDILPSEEWEAISRLERIKLYNGDATDPELIAEQHFDIIIDDAEHTLDNQVSLLSALWPKLTAGGFYIIEDLFVGELPWGGHACGPRHRGFIRYDGAATGGETIFLPRHPQDLNYLNRKNLPANIQSILDNNSHFFTITAVGGGGGLHMMLVIVKS